MRNRFQFFYIFVGVIFLSIVNPVVTRDANAEKFLKVELRKELEKGYLFIGLKQYLGGAKDSFSKNKNITFSSENGFLSLNSVNGIKLKSKTINIIWKDVPLKAPYTLERLVFGPYASYESAQRQASKLKQKGFKPTIAYPDNWEVWIPFGNDLPNHEFKYKLSKKSYISQITPFLNSEDSLQKLEGPIYITADEEIKINNINFGKEFYLAQDSYGTWTLIQKIKFDDYLAGVLPYEIGPNSPLEALKAQAVIARTWAIYNSERFNMDKYHLCVTTQCQVYKPPKVENKKVQTAIKQTSNLVIKYRNQPINSFYHGSNGGITASASESWKIRDYPYFKTVIDGSRSLTASFTVPILNESELKKFLDFHLGEFYGKKHSLFRWERKVSGFIIADNLMKHELIDKIEKVVDFKIIERGLSGRVTKLEIKTNSSSKPILLVKDDIRRILSFLPSNLFIITKLNDDLWAFDGGGFGHGVGLSQAGAIEMAELGFTYEQILNHYYQGTKVKKIDILSQ